MTIDSTPIAPFALWKSALAVNISAKMRELRADGTTAISFENLFAILRFPPNGPTGTNARYTAKQAVRDILSANKNLSKMILPE